MRKIGLLFLALLLAACTPASISITGTASATRTIIPAPTLTLPSSATPLPTQTSAPPTLTPLPTIPTFTPTFDARTIVTVTPAAMVVCPKEDPAIKMDPQIVISDADPKVPYNILQQRLKPIERLLNRGFKPSLLLSALRNKHIMADYNDITGDGVKEVILSNVGNFSIFYCVKGSYNLFNDSLLDESKAPYLTTIDLNKNGLPEIIISDGPAGSHGGFISRIYEWDGSDFVDLSSHMDESWWTGSLTKLPKVFEITDVNQDGLKDLVLTGWLDRLHVGDSYIGNGADMNQDENPLSRVKTVVYSWNGTFYSETYLSYAAPQYRFQAIQDADRETLYGHYEKALSFYKAAIFNSALEWSSHNRTMYLVNINLAPIIAAQKEAPLESFPTPVPDLTEYPRLAAYAGYRMVILYTYLGERDAAQAQYTDLQAKFPADSPGYPYVEMASHFWTAYQSTGKMYNACAAAIVYADTWPKILYPLYSWDDLQSHPYTPADVCPFR